MSLANNVIPLFADNTSNNEGIISEIIPADYFDYAEIIPITELLKVLQKNNSENSA